MLRSPAPDGQGGWLLEHLGGVFTVLRFGDESEGPAELRRLGNLRPELSLVQVSDQRVPQRQGRSWATPRVWRAPVTAARPARPI